jgi:hypothetical protein
MNYMKRDRKSRGLYIQKSRIDCYSTIYLQQHIMGEVEWGTLPQSNAAG